MTVAVYPGTFDPIHYGHVDIAKRAAALFDKLIVAVYDRPNKNLLFTAQERLVLAQESLQDVPNIEVVTYTGLTAYFVQQQGADVIVRGLRAISDFEMEYQMALITRRLAPQLEMMCLMTSQEYAFISSTIVKDIAKAGGSVEQFVPRNVEQALRLKHILQ